MGQRETSVSIQFVQAGGGQREAFTGKYQSPEIYTTSKMT
jgi:hypothetical protein